MAIWRVRIGCWILKATNTHLGYVILIAFPLQQWVQKRVSMLRHTYTACLVINQCVSCEVTAGAEEKIEHRACSIASKCTMSMSMATRLRYLDD
jgi:hypothetical protein